MGGVATKHGNEREDDESDDEDDFAGCEVEFRLWNATGRKHR